MPHALLFLFAVLPAASQAAPVPEPLNEFGILERVKLNVKAQLAIAANYTCVETTERTYYTEKNACLGGRPGKRKEFMRDRLRLDVAVSEGKEIFSWHGQSHFVSSDISKVIPAGPRTSGQFVGFLHNIFLEDGIRYSFLGKTQEGPKDLYQFNYVVQWLQSDYILHGRGEPFRIPYHGSFSVDAATFELARLTIVADDVPLSSGICGAETDIDYQFAKIAGVDSLLPATFDLKMESEGDVYSLNHNEYTQCREFRGESTIHFTVVEGGPATKTRRVIDEPLPAGLTLHVGLDQQIDDKDAYVGDAVSATLLESVSIPGKNEAIHKGATVRGVISKMERHSESLAFWLFGIKLERLEDGDDSYIFNATPLPLGSRGNLSPFHSARVLSSDQYQAALQGYWFLDGSHFKLPKNFTSYWRTEQPPQKAAAPTNEP